MILMRESLRLRHDEFEAQMAQDFGKMFNKTFKKKRILVGPNKYHEFDLVSEDTTIVIECKSYKWTKGSNLPSAKISTAIEALFYLSRIMARKKILVFQEDYDEKGNSLVDIFIRGYDGIMDDVEIYRYEINENEVQDQVVPELVRPARFNWYKKMLELATE